MRNKSEKLTLLGIIALLISSIITVLPVFSALLPRHFPSAGGVGVATFYTTPRDNNFTNPPTTVGTWFTIDIRIANATNIASWQVELSYNKNYLFTAAANVSYAPDMIFPGGTYSPIAPSTGSENVTHDYVLMTATTTGAIEYNSGVWPASKGLIRISFKIIATPGPGQTLWTSLRFEKPGIFGCWTSDTDLNDNELYLYDGYFQIMVQPLPPPYLALSPTAVVKPTISGNRIIGTPDAFFNVNMLINNVSSSDFLILVQFNVTYDRTLLKVDNVLEGTFMNNSVWAPYGTMFGWNEDPGMVSGFVIILPNGTTGEWDMAQFPSGSDLLLTIRFKAIYQPENATNSRTTDLLLNGIFDSFFVSANETDIPYDPPVSGSYTIFGFNWRAPTPQFTWTPSTPLINAPITFNASGSRGYRNDEGVLKPELSYIASYFWDFGDGSNSTVGPITTHAYTAMGNYNVTLRLTDNDDKTNSLTRTVAAYEMFSLTITTTLGGTTVPTPGGYPYFPGDNATVTAVPDTDYYFDHWELDSVDVGSVNPITVTMDSVHLLHAVFFPKLRLTITVTLGGTTSPAPGQYLYLPGTNVNVTAIPAAGYYFDHWELDSVDVGSVNPITVTMDSDHPLHALFSERPSLQVQADVGSLHFPGETAEFNILVSFHGSLVNATTINFRLYYGGTSSTPSWVIVSTGLYRILYDVPSATGTYTLVVQAEYGVAAGNTLKSFLVSPGFGEAGALLVDIKDEMATILIPDIGYIRANLTTINAKLSSIQGDTALIITDLGIVKGNLTSIGAKLTSIQGSLVTIQTSLGTITTNLNNINATISELVVDSKGEILAKIDTALGPVTAKLNTIGADVTTVKGDTASVRTTLGDVETSLGSIQGIATTTLYATSALSAIAAIVGIIILLLLFRKK